MIDSITADNAAAPVKLDISVVVPCYNARDTLAALLESLARQDYRGHWETVVVDNGSTDSSAGIAADFASRVANLRTLRAVDAQGAAHARNAGVGAAAAGRIAFCDADDVVDSGWVRAMAAALDSRDLVASRVDLARLNTESLRLGRGAPQSEGVQPYNYPPFLPHAGGSGLGVRRWVHEAIGGFDEALPLLEDTDYCWRAQLAGADFGFAPDALIHVRLRDDLKTMCLQSYRWGLANVQLYDRYRRHGMPPLSASVGLRRTLGVLVRVHWLLDRRARARWLWQASWQAGRLAGSLRHGTFAL